MFRHLERLYIYDEVHTQESTARSLFQLAKSLFEGCSTLKKIGFYLCDPYVTVEKIVSARFTKKKTRSFQDQLTPRTILGITLLS